MTGQSKGIDWGFAPSWLTIEQACFLSGWDRDSMLQIIAENGVDLKDGPDILIDKQSLWDFQETVALIQNYD